MQIDGGWGAPSFRFLTQHCIRRSIPELCFEAQLAGFSWPARLTLPPAADTIKTSTTGLEQGRQFPRQISMKLAYFDCFSGISGDMTLGALVDAGCDAEQLRSGLRGLQVPGWELSAEKVWKNGMAATYVEVRTEDQQKHRSLSGILKILKDSKLAAPVRDRASAIFTKLGQAEARVHDVPLEKIHFHEVGAVDAIVKINFFERHVVHSCL